LGFAFLVLARLGDLVTTYLVTPSLVLEANPLVRLALRSFRREVQHRNAILRQANAEQQRVVAERAATKRQIEAGLGERQRMLSSIKSEIARLQAEERHRQATAIARDSGDVVAANVGGTDKELTEIQGLIEKHPSYLP
jgi:septal ring factor EnvC (AmiA/AmiB activator)